jgi:predicted glycoside hydrolase/deacetylase ChbG (UPF0249 family)
MGGIRLITRADDAGMARGANRAIVEACTRGIARNVSVMVPAPHFQDAAELLKDLPGVELGVHFTLNAEWDNVRWGPVLPPERVPSLVDEHGLFFSTPTQMHEHHARQDEMLAEARAQIERARAAGLKVAYMDSHMGVEWVAKTTEKLARLAEQEGLLWANPLGARLPKVPETTQGYPERLVAQLEAAADGTYVTVGHPTYDDEELRRFRINGSPEGEVARDRDGQRRMFTDPKVLACIAARRVQPTRYSESTQN